MEPTNFPFGLSRETTIRRSADGKWSHDGDPLDNEKLSRAFDRWITRAEDGRWCLKNDINWAYFTLEGAPWFVRSVKLQGERAELLLSDDRRVPLDFRTLREGPDGVLYCDVDGAHGRDAARFESHAAVQLGELLQEDERGPYFPQGGERIRPPRVQEPVAPEPVKG